MSDPKSHAKQPGGFQGVLNENTHDVSGVVKAVHAGIDPGATVLPEPSQKAQTDINPHFIVHQKILQSKVQTNKNEPRETGGVYFGVE